MGIREAVLDLTPGRRRALGLLMLLPPAEQRSLLQRMGEKQRRHCEELLNRVRDVPPAEIVELAIAELERVLMAGQSAGATATDAMAPGPGEAATGTEEQLAGPDTTAVEDQVEQEGDSAQTRTLADLVAQVISVEPARLAAVLGRERPKLVSAALYYLPEERAAQVLAMLPPETAREAFVGLPEAASLPKPFFMAVLTRVLEAVQRCQEEAEAAQGHRDDRERLVLLARSLSSEKRTEFLSTLKERSPELAEYIRKNIYTFEDFLRIADSCIQKILSEVELRTVALAIKNASAELKTKIASNLSKRVRESLFEELEMLGAVPPAKVAEAQQELLNLVLQLDEKGELIMDS